MIALLDVNVLIALAWPNHVHHGPAHSWFRSQQATGWATCPLTQSGFIRVSSNVRVTPEARSPQEAALLLRRMISHPNHVFWTDDISLSDEKWISLGRIATYHQVTDAHLLALALARGGQLATFDRAVSRLLPQDVDALQRIPF